ncbi:MAG: hypothetical protein V3U11_11705 [Planctomycetota bacterium]
MKIKLWSRGPGGGEIHLSKVGSCIRISIDSKRLDTVNLISEQATDFAEAILAMVKMGPTPIPEDDPWRVPEEMRGRRTP